MQKRRDNSLSFYKLLNHYKQGFGDIQNNFWMGLDNIHKLTKNKPGRLKIYIEYFDGTTRVAIYEGFSVGDEASDYRLYFHYFTDSSSGEGLVNETQFTMKWGGYYYYYYSGWWYGNDVKSNLNGKHSMTDRNYCIKYFSSVCIKTVTMSVLIQ